MSEARHPDRNWPAGGRLPRIAAAVAFLRNIAAGDANAASAQILKSNLEDENATQNQLVLCADTPANTT
jgi:hypothetical protein